MADVFYQDFTDELFYDTTDTILKLITSQYQNSPKFLHYVRTFLNMVQDVRELARVVYWLGKDEEL